MASHLLLAGATPDPHRGKEQEPMKAPEPLPVFEFSAEEMEQAEQASKYINEQAEQASKEMARLAADLFGEEQEQSESNSSN